MSAFCMRFAAAFVKRPQHAPVRRACIPDSRLPRQPVHPYTASMETLWMADFWIGLVKIVWIDVILSGDNAVVIALAARALPPQQQRKAIVWGCGFAIALRIALTMVAAELMQLPFLQILGGGLLLWIALGLLHGNAGSADGVAQAAPHSSMLGAIRTILLADLVMCLDNVIAVAATADGHMLLLVLGLGLSIPLVLFGSTVMIALMQRFPWIVTAGAGLIGWVAGETMASDQLLQPHIAQWPAIAYVAAACGAALVLLLGHWRKQRKNTAPAA